jgi:hypothetical protein
VDDLLDVVGRFCEFNSPPEHVLVIVPKPMVDAALRVTSSSKYIDRLPASSRIVNEPVTEVHSFDQRGFCDWPWREQIVRAGMTHLFRVHNGLIDGAPIFHYVKPSGKHCSAFLRAANVLVHGTEIDFVAACCLSFVQPNVRHIYTDTGAIHSVAYALLRIYGLFDDVRKQATISSFGSYTKLKEFPFE